MSSTTWANLIPDISALHDGILPAVDGFMTDYEAAYTDSQSLDEQIQNAAGAVSSDYAAITTAAVRQV